MENPVCCEAQQQWAEGTIKPTACDGTVGSRTLGGGVIQSLASMVRALVSMRQDSMRSLLWHCRDFQADSDWRGMRGFLIGVMGMKTRVDYYDARIHSYGFWKSILIADLSLPPYNYPGWCPDIFCRELKVIFVNRPTFHNIIDFNEPYL